MNSDQGSHFTNPDYIKLLEDNGIRISMDGKGQALDNVRTERNVSFVASHIAHMILLEVMFQTRSTMESHQKKLLEKIRL